MKIRLLSGLVEAHGDDTVYSPLDDLPKKLPLNPFPEVLFLPQSFYSYLLKFESTDSFSFKNSLVLKDLFINSASFSTTGESSCSK